MEIWAVQKGSNILLYKDELDAYLDIKFGDIYGHAVINNKTVHIYILRALEIQDSVIFSGKYSVFDTPKFNHLEYYQLANKLFQTAKKLS